MSKVIIRRDGGVTIEADLTFAEIKELAGVNGHKPERPEPLPTRPIASTGIGDFTGFVKDLSERGAKFVDALRQHQAGISAEQLAPLLGYDNANQIGGLTGGGIAKLVAKHGISMADIYSSELKFPDGKRVRMFYPGRLLRGQENPHK